MLPRGYTVDAIDRLGRIDLNLLVSLYVLLDERNVTRAAERLFITQPAASRTLTRLRELFDDPLLTRQGSDMVMTPRAQQLKEQLPRALGIVGDLVAPVKFDPAVHEQAFQVALPEVFGQAMIRALLQDILTEAPNISLSFCDPDERAIQGLLSGEVDFLLRKSEPGAMPAALQTEPLCKITGMIVARKDHPLVRKRKTSLEQLLDFPWIDPYPRNAPTPVGPLDELLRARGLQRRIVFRSTHLLAAVQGLAGSDCLMYLANAGEKTGAPPPQVTVLATPDEIREHVYEVELIQHRRTLNSDSHNWLKAKLIRLLSSSSPPGAVR